MGGDRLMRMRIARKNKRRRDPRYFLNENLDLENQATEEEFTPEASSDPSSSPSQIVSDITFRTASGVEFGTDYAEDPTYAPPPAGHGLGAGEYNIRGQYLIYRLDGKLRYLNLDASGIKERHYDLLHNGLKTEGWEYNENAAIPTPEDYRGVK